MVRQIKVTGHLAAGAPPRPFNRPTDRRKKISNKGLSYPDVFHENVDDSDLDEGDFRVIWKRPFESH